MSKQLMYDEDARRKVRQGAVCLANAVRVTIGPAGGNVILEKKFGSPEVTRDGNTVSKEIELSDPFENMGARMIRSVAEKTSDVAGDGTTTAALLAEAILLEGLRRTESGVNPVLVQRGITKAAEAAVEAMRKHAREVKSKDDIAHIGTVAAKNDPAIGKLFAEAFEKVGREGVVTVEEGKTLETSLEVVRGMRFDKGYQSPYFVTSTVGMTAELEKPFILLYEKKLSNVKEMLPLLEKVLAASRPLVVIAEEVEGESLALLVVNKLRGAFKAAAVKAPGFGDRRKAMMEDIALLTGGRFISEDLGVKLENVTLEDLGQADRVVMDKDNTTIIGGSGDKKRVQERIDQLKLQMGKTTSDYDREKLEERIAKLAGGVAIVRVGGATEPEMKSRKARVEGALHATRAAIEEGVVAGGGIAFLRAIPEVGKLMSKVEDDERIGVACVLKALEVPVRQIVGNAGADGSEVVEDLKGKSDAIGYDATTGAFVDMFKSGITDAFKVCRVGLQNAASMAGLILTTDVLITELPDKGKKKSVIEGAVR
ncbi:MAG: chaperonin GroEL [Planctomycetota bacterium]